MQSDGTTGFFFIIIVDKNQDVWWKYTHIY